MYQVLENSVKDLLAAGGAADAVVGGVVGLEKESLRVSPDGGIAQTPHPAALGSALVNPYITTDYSEALLELITPPCDRPGEALRFLGDLQKFVHDNLENEILWATSMPCVLAGGANIPIARYGTSNAGIMKSVYRRGLGHRYGRTMQVIAGVHFNYSVAEAFWPLFQEIRREQGTIADVRNRAYLGMIRNLQRYGWLIPYLFGASPAVCKSFLGDKPTSLAEFDATTYYEPFATSLRMGDIGYTNSREKGVGIKANYNSLEAYIDSITRAIETPSPLWGAIGVKVEGEYRQLNANILQIENEYYSTVRPKQVVEGMEKPSLALKRRGVRYVELRSVDVNAFHPLGVSEQQLEFLRLFMLFCLLAESPPINVQERREIDQNLGGAAHRGRDPSLHLLRTGREISLTAWATELMSAMQAVADLLDHGHPGAPAAQVLADQLEVVRDPERTPSARMLQEMRSNGEGFFQFAWRMSEAHDDYFSTLELDEAKRTMFRELAISSARRQREIEGADRISFDQFLADYFNQGPG